MGRLEEIEKKFSNYFKLFTDEKHIPDEFYIKKDELIYLLSEVKRLRGAIEKHKRVLHDESPEKYDGVEEDKELYKALEEV